MSGFFALLDDIATLAKLTLSTLDDTASMAAGGRVLSVVATGQSVAAARARAYEAIGLIHLDGAQVRTDIAADR